MAGNLEARQEDCGWVKAGGGASPAAPRCLLCNVQPCANLAGLSHTAIFPLPTAPCRYHKLYTLEKGIQNYFTEEGAGGRAYQISTFRCA